MTRIGQEPFGSFIYQEPDFSQIWDLGRNIANGLNFHQRPNTGKINNQFFSIQKTLFFCTFLVHFSIFDVKNIFCKNPTLSCTCPYSPLTPYKVSEKTNEPIPQKRKNRWRNKSLDPNSQDLSGHNRGSKIYCRSEN